MNMDHRMSVAVGSCCNAGGSGGGSTVCPKRRRNENQRLQLRHVPRRRSLTLFFTLALWVTEAAMLLLQNSCNGFAPTGYHVLSTPLSFPSPQHKKENRWQPREHRLYHLAAEASSGNTADSPDEETITAPISSILATEDEKKQTEGIGAARYSTQSTSFLLSTLFSLDLPLSTESRRQRVWNYLKQNLLFWRNRNDESGNATSTTITALDFAYDYDVIEIPYRAYLPPKVKTTGIMLIHPIGVGIARWYYQRLVSSLVERYERIGERVVIVVPDLLGSGSACNAMAGTEVAPNFPLFNISDWTDQVESLMSTVEATTTGKIDEWCVVANGGCSPIALQLAQRKKLENVEGTSKAPVSNLILSSVPRLPFFMKNETTNDPAKVAKSFRTLSGIPGKLFWWYSCRNNGAFIQTFSEKNLIADPMNLGPNWRSNCYETATAFDGRGKYATFSFLAGTLQDGCIPSLDAIKDTPLAIDIIKGIDVRRNQAKSWFWQKPKTQTTKKKDRKTFRDYVEENGNGGRELIIGGRISLAHEDPEGYADAILQFLLDD